MERSEESPNQDENCWEDESNDTVPPHPHILMRKHNVHTQELELWTYVSVRKLADTVVVVLNVRVGVGWVDPHGDGGEESKHPTEKQGAADY